MGETFTLRARYVFPVACGPISDGAVVVSDGRIAAVGEASVIGHAGPLMDLGNAALLPGLVNAHTHLDLSGLRHPLGRPGIAMDDWVRLLMEHRRKSAKFALATAVAAGLRESLVGGVTLLGEVAQPGWPLGAFQSGSPHATAFLEIIAPTADRIPAARQQIAKQVELARSEEGGSVPVTLGLAPHAPHTVHREFLAEIVETAALHGLPLAFHLAESREELELLQHGTGPLAALLADLGAWDPRAVRLGARPLDYLQTLVAAPRVLVIHGNYLDEEEIAFLAEQRDRMTLVYCPRTHAWFGHPPFPLEKLLAAGVHVALGTDSRASSPDLSLLAEMRFVARHYRAIDRSTVVTLGTQAGAAALAAEAGVIATGRRADLVAVELPHGNGDPYDLLLLGEGAVAATWIGGQRFFAATR